MWGDTGREWPVSEYFNEGPESRREAYFAMPGIIHDLNIARLASAGGWRTDTILQFRDFVETAAVPGCHD